MVWILMCAGRRCPEIAELTGYRVSYVRALRKRLGPLAIGAFKARMHHWTHEERREYHRQARARRRLLVNSAG